jgi:hypothetical protein
MKRVAAVVLAVLFAAALVPFAKEKHQGPYVLKAKGSHGWIKFTGSGPGTARVAGKGALTIENISRQTVLKVDGTWGEKDDFPDGVRYTHFEGSVETSGIGVQLEMRGWNLELSAKGIGGMAKFQGEGTAQLDDGPEQPWPGADNSTHSWLKISYGDH